MLSFLLVFFLLFLLLFNFFRQLLFISTIFWMVQFLVNLEDLILCNAKLQNNIVCNDPCKIMFVLFIQYWSSLLTTIVYKSISPCTWLLYCTFYQIRLLKGIKESKGILGITAFVRYFPISNAYNVILVYFSSSS